MRQKFLETAKEKHLDFYERLRQAIRRPESSQGGNGEVIIFYNVLPSGNEDKDEVTVSAVDKILTDVIEESESVIYVDSQKARLEQLKHLIRERRLKKFMENQNSLRAYQDLSRVFFKTLEELRKQQAWRYERETIRLMVEEVPELKPSKKSK